MVDMEPTIKRIRKVQPYLEAVAQKLKDAGATVELK